MTRPVPPPAGRPHERPLRDWPLRRRFGASVVVATVLLAGLAALVLMSFVRVGSAQTRVTETYFAATRSSSELLGAYLDQETGVRGYLLTGDRRFLEPYERGRTEEDAATAELGRLLRDDPPLVEQLAEVRRWAADWRSGYAAPTVAMVDAGRRGDVTADQQAGGKRRFDHLRQVFTGFDAAVVRARAGAVDDLSRGRTLLAAAFIGLAAFVVAALAGLGLALRRWILDPLDAVRTDVGAVADGELEHAIAPAGPPDLRAVAGDVDRMRVAMLRSYSEQVAARRTVEQQRELLERQTDDLRRSNAELEQFAYVASHDLQEPLRKVASFTELLQRRYAGQLDERADSYIEFAVDGARRMQRLINDLLAFSRVGRVGVTHETVALDGALDRARQNLSAVVEEKGATIEAAPLPAVTGDPGLLAQVFQNLLSNALKFSRPDVPPRVRISCGPDDDGWRIDVEDNGIGIDPEYEDRIFVIFSRLNRREDYPGTGIGLALVKKIVEYHGGRIGLGPHTGAGATIRFTLPAIGRGAEGAT